MNPMQEFEFIAGQASIWTQSPLNRPRTDNDTFPALAAEESLNRKEVGEGIVAGACRASGAAARPAQSHSLMPVIEISALNTRAEVKRTPEAKRRVR